MVEPSITSAFNVTIGMDQAMTCTLSLLLCGHWSLRARAQLATWSSCDPMPPSCPLRKQLHVGLGAPNRLQAAQDTLRGRWLITVGDSTARFFYAALLSAVNGTVGRASGFPLHTLPVDDPCSFERNGWVAIPQSPHDRECLRRWRGGCAGYSKSDIVSRSGCVMDVELYGARYTFIWSTYVSNAASVAETTDTLRRLVSTQNVATTQLAPILLHGGGWWDLHNFNHVLPNMSRSERAMSMARGLRTLLGGLQAAVAHSQPPGGGRVAALGIELGLTACTGKEVNKSALARRSIAAVANEAGFLVLERMPAMVTFTPRFWPNNPCHNSHPYGVMSDLHVQALLIGLQLRAQRGGRPISPMHTEALRLAEVPPPPAPWLGLSTGDASADASAQVQVLVMIVGLWRAAERGRASLETNLVQSNPHVSFRFMVCTDGQATCSSKDVALLGRPSSASCSVAPTNLSRQVEHLYRGAIIDLASELELQPFRGGGNLYGTGGVFRRRLQHCLSRVPAALLAASRVVVVLRPDVLFSRPMLLPDPWTSPTFSIILGSLRRACVFSDRDVDFGYVSAPPSSLSIFLSEFNETLPARVPPLPDGFDGFWQGSSVASMRHMKDRCRGNGVAVFANKILELRAAGSPLTAAHATAWGRGVYLSLARPGKWELAARQVYTGSKRSLVRIGSQRAAPTHARGHRLTTPNAPHHQRKVASVQCHIGVGPAESSSLTRLCMATINDGTIHARVIVDFDGCVPFWLPPGYRSLALLTCHDKRMETTVSRREMNVTAPHEQRACVASDFDHGFYRKGRWHSACSPAVGCSPVAGRSIFLTGDSVASQQMAHWVESFWGRSNLTVGTTQGVRAKDGGISKLGAVEDPSYEDLRQLFHVRNGVISSVLTQHPNGGIFAFASAPLPAGNTETWMTHLFASDSNLVTGITSMQQLLRALGGHALGSNALSGQSTQNQVQSGPRFDTTLFSFGYHQTWTAAEMEGRARALFERLVQLSPTYRGWVYLLNTPPNTSRVPDKYKEDRETRTVLGTWLANQAVLNAASASGIAVADLFSPTLVFMEQVHCAVGDAVHLTGCEQATTMRLLLLSRMCLGQTSQIHYTQSLDSLALANFAR